MLLRPGLFRSALLLKPSASIYIYLRDHNKHINPESSKLNLSYAHPNGLASEAPAQKISEYQLLPETEALIQRQVFEEYKNKILRGIIDEETVKEPDPLWGDEPPPTHYYNRTSKIDLMRVSYPQNDDAEAMLQSSYEQFFVTTLEGEITKDLIQASDIHQLVQVSLAARKQGVEDGQLWFWIESGLKRGKILYLLQPEELIKLKYAFDGKIKHGTPIFHKILGDLLREDIPQMKKSLLLSFFYACRYSNPGKNNLQNDILEALKPTFKNFTFEEKTQFLLAFSLCTKPIKFATKSQQRRRYEFKQFASAILLQLDLWELELNDEAVARLVFSLAKLHLDNTRFITYPLRDYISQNLQTYCSQPSRLFQAIAYLGHLEAGQGVMDQTLAGRLRELALQRWSQFSKIQQIRMIHAFWNLGLMDEALLELYKGVQLESDSSLLYYACQIELHTSSQREWQIIQCLAHIEHLPLPYFTTYKRFYNYIKSTTQWNLTPLADKLRNVEYHYSVMRQYDTLLKVKHYRKLREFQKFAGVHFTQIGAPIENLELTHFGFPLHKVSLDIVAKKEFIPGTTQLKESYMNKVRSLKSIGWKHLAFTEQQLRDKTLSCMIQNIQKSFQSYVQEQQVIIDYQEFKIAQEIETYKQIEEMVSWDLTEINSFMSRIQGLEDIQLEDDGLDPLNFDENTDLSKYQDDDDDDDDDQDDKPKKKKK